MLLNKKTKIPILIGFSFVVILLFLRFFVFKSIEAIKLISSISDLYLFLIEKFANLLLRWADSEVYIINHNIILDGKLLSGFVLEVMFIKICFIVFILIWLTKANVYIKILFTIILILASFLFASVYIASGAHLASFGDISDTFPALAYCLGNISMITILFIWYKMNKESILNRLMSLKINRNFFEKKIPAIFILGYFYFIIIHLVLQNYVDLYSWINFDLKLSQYGIILLGEKVTVVPYNLVGNNGIVFVNNGCLGLKSMFLFGSLIYLTKNDKISFWIYIISGILFLNFLNIVRLTLLFVLIQKPENVNNMHNLHDLSNYIIYIVIFILWVIWFEKFSDVRSKKEKVDTKTEDFNY